MNICGLSKDTKLFLDYKAKKEKENQILLDKIKEDVNLDETFENESEKSEKSDSQTKIILIDK